MMLRFRLSALFVLASVLATQTVTAQAEEPAAPPAEPKSGFRADVLLNVGFAMKRLLQLAEAIPQEKYSWRPAEGVRSVGELFLHIAGGQFGIPRMLGVEPPAGMDPKTFEKSVTDKAKIVELLKQSWEHARQAVLKTPDEALDRTRKAFGMELSLRFFVIVLVQHIHGHMGQLSTYARVNGVVPPWVAEEKAKAKEGSQ